MPRATIKEEYKIVSEIGAGGMAIVYKAVQKSLDRPVAIKELKKSYHEDSRIVARFERESIVAASLQHENIVHIYDYWKKPDHAIVMEYVDGANLADIIEKTGALPVDVGVMIALQVCSALEYAHMRGLVHRDIKPSNIMIKRNGEVKLMDFGIAQSRNLEGMTIPGTMIGTPAYMSPEQVLGTQLDARSDIFSLGIVLFEMFTGVKPFMDDIDRSVSAKILEDRFPAPRDLNSGISRGLQRVIKKCLRKKPQKRYGSMMEIERKLGKRIAGRTTKAGSLQRIAAYLVSMSVFEAVPDQEAMIITAKVPIMAKIRRALLPAALAFFVAAGGAASFYFWMRSKQPVFTPSVIPAAAPSSGAVVTQPRETNAPAKGPTRREAATAPTGTPFAAISSGPAASSGGIVRSPVNSSSTVTSIPNARNKKRSTTDRKKTAAKSSKKKKTSSEK